MVVNVGFIQMYISKSLSVAMFLYSLFQETLNKTVPPTWLRLLSFLVVLLHLVFAFLRFALLALIRRVAALSMSSVSSVSLPSSMSISGQSRFAILVEWESDDDSQKSEEDANCQESHILENYSRKLLTEYVFASTKHDEFGDLQVAFIDPNLSAFCWYSLYCPDQVWSDLFG